MKVRSSKNGPAYLLFVEAGAPLAKMLAREVWQLWRYQGGSEQERKMTTAVMTEVDSDFDAGEEPEIVDELEEGDDPGMDLEHSTSTE